MFNEKNEKKVNQMFACLLNGVTFFMFLGKYIISQRKDIKETTEKNEIKTESFYKLCILKCFLSSTIMFQILYLFILINKFSIKLFYIPEFILIIMFVL